MNQKRAIAFLTIIVPVFFYALYILLKLDTVGGFFERQEVSIKLFLSILVLVGSTILSIGELKKRNILWFIVYEGLSMLAIFSIIVVYGFRHGVGF